MWYMVIVYAVYDVFTDDVGVAYQEEQHGNSDLLDRHTITVIVRKPSNQSRDMA